MLKGRVLPMINFFESIETLTTGDLERENNDPAEEIYPLFRRNISEKKLKRKPGVRKRIPPCNWTMPAQPEGYIRAGKFDLL